MWRPSEYVKRLRRFQTPAALLGPADVSAARPVVVTPPPITIPPGPAPCTKERSEAIGARREESRLKPAREKPARKTLRMFGEKICVSSTLATCIRRAE